jgi:hypothetical protein
MIKLLFPTGPAFLLLLLTCCTSSPSIVGDPRTGETASCAVTALSQAIAEEVAVLCRQNYEAAGWVIVPGPVADTIRSVGL